MKQPCPDHRDRRSKLACRAWIAVAFAAIVGLTIGRNCPTPVYVVDGTSMAPTYTSGMRVGTVPVTAPLQRGDIVVIDDGGAGRALKRIVGLPGETINIWRGHVFINNEMLIEPYLAKHTVTYPIERKYVGASFKVGVGQYFVLGDNRLESADSRTYGPVPKDRIKRLIPLPEGFTRARFAHYTLPAPGTSLIRPL